MGIWEAYSQKFEGYCGVVVVVVLAPCMHEQKKKRVKRGLFLYCRKPKAGNV